MSRDTFSIWRHCGFQLSICRLTRNQLEHTVCPGASRVTGKLKPIFKLFSVIVEVHGHLSPAKCVKLAKSYNISNKLICLYDSFIECLEVW